MAAAAHDWLAAHGLVVGHGVVDVLQHLLQPAVRVDQAAKREKFIA